ncbi:hypothetical protein BR63_17040 [Thermanaerosceptrum fracticalcis]|uniref:Uncharacterized protein n=1 Tax=Thermanaerosceptrum fracticalcis TaxID=1712410 RepID=A0A7G6E6W4_THEFR|nr:hypothetical protein [Thermanaerosceptrum fracticalcis]QNB47818.1 hypothetical protein BR63_17040 [Thermanaerosceptrum fracticalcis]
MISILERFALSFSKVGQGRLMLMPTLFGGHLITVSGGCHGTPSKVASRLDIFANGGGRFLKVPESTPLLAVG